MYLFYNLSLIQIFYNEIVAASIEPLTRVCGAAVVDFCISGAERKLKNEKDR